VAASVIPLASYDCCGDTALMQIVDLRRVNDPRRNGCLPTPFGCTDAGSGRLGGALARVFGSRAAMESVVVLEDGAKFSRERFRLAGVSGRGAEEAAVVAREHGRLLTE
jgi:hypothetical protein